MKFTEDFSDKIKRIKDAISSADAVVVGAGAGLSTAAGYSYSGERFEENFADFENKYGFHDMYSGGFYPYSSPQEFWAFWSRNIYLNRYTPTPKPVYEKLLRLIGDKEYFVITTNVDHCFQKAGFDKNRLFYTQGDYGLFQCEKPCHRKTYDNEEIIKKMYFSQVDMKVPTELLPKCPVCGRPMTTNLRIDDAFVEDDGWKAASGRYAEFLKKYDGKKVVFLELGVGGNTPVIIKYPFWKMTLLNKSATYVCVNYGEAACPDEIADRAILMDCDISSALDGFEILT